MHTHTVAHSHPGGYTQNNKFVPKMPRVNTKATTSTTTTSTAATTTTPPPPLPPPPTTTTNNGNAADNILQETPHKSSSSTIKCEEMSSPAEGQQVFHRKSERRKVARDIFLVFEEHPSNRRSRGAKRSNRCGRMKPKFGHLKVENPATCKRKSQQKPTQVARKTTTPTTLLRDIKNETKSFNSQAASNGTNVQSKDPATPDAANVQHHSPPPTSRVAVAKVAPALPSPATAALIELPAPPVSSAGASATETSSPAAAATPAPAAVVPKHTGKGTPKNTAASLAKKQFANEFNGRRGSDQSNATPAGEGVARVNPIFLWVKQDDTRIVEVKCEDYDKRNRIRIKKTTNGWRAIPRTDPSTSKVVKYIQSPFVKVKRETAPPNAQSDDSEAAANVGVARAFAGSRQSCVDDMLASDSNNSHSNATDLAEKNFPNDKLLPLITEDLRKPAKSSDSHESFWSYDKSEVAEVKKDLTERAPEEHEEITQTVEGFAEEPAIVASSNEDEQKFNANFGLALKSASLDEEEEAEEEGGSLDSMAPRPATPRADQLGDEHGNTNGTYQTARTPELQLCPKTGYFLPNSLDMQRHEASPPTPPSDEGQSQMPASDDAESEQSNGVSLKLAQPMDEDLMTRLDAESRNLKDLLDDADLLQHYGEHLVGGSELIDSLVKHSCEHNLIQDADPVKDSHSPIKPSFEPRSADVAEVQPSNSSLLSLERDVVVVSAAAVPVSDSPKCLSFNEAGEIESINGEQLFHLDPTTTTFPKETITAITDGPLADLSNHSTTELSSSRLVSPPPHTSSAHSSVISGEGEAGQAAVGDSANTEDDPKDLSYKKREEVCPPPESRSQCAVTSSSDVVKSPGHEEDGDLPTIETTSEAIKNLILEQFIKLSTLNNMTAATAGAAVSAASSGGVGVKGNSATAKEMLQPLDQAGPAHRRSTASESGDSTSSLVMPTSNFIETVVIDDNSNDHADAASEPAKKRLRVASGASPSACSTTTSISAATVGVAAMAEHAVPAAAPSILDKDPDPLTQLQLLLRNAEWKVPDPILVPKERLSAVLASPAREIPLLITTRPELRLPEAFAYPEIIQNPNILVISMAQLEAILRNEQEREAGKRKSSQAMAGSGEKRGNETAATEGVALLQRCNVGGAAAGLSSPHGSGNKVNSKTIINIPSNSTAHHPQNSSSSSSSSNNMNVVAGVKSVKMAASDMPAQELNTKCSHNETSSTSSSSSSSSKLASDINAATLAVLNQMLWLPYIEELAHSSAAAKTATSSAKNTVLKPTIPKIPNTNIGDHHHHHQHHHKPHANNSGGGTNQQHHHQQQQQQSHKHQQQQQEQLQQQRQFQQLELRHLDELYKNYMKELSKPLLPQPLMMPEPPTKTPPLTSFPQQMLSNLAAASATNNSLGAAMRGFQNPLELAIYHKLLQCQMQNLLSNSVTMDDVTPPPTKVRSSHAPQQQEQPPEHSASKVAKSKAAAATHSNGARSMYENSGGARPLTADQRQPQTLAPEIKPRLTCKSLSNLLEPESVQGTPSSSSSASSLTASAEALLSGLVAGDMNAAPAHSSDGGEKVDLMKIAEKHFAMAAHTEGNTFVGKLNVAKAHPFGQRNNPYHHDGAGHALAAMATHPDAGPTDGNTALWHPLFGSNAKATGYSSPWQWTTVTATGE